MRLDHLLWLWRWLAPPINDEEKMIKTISIRMFL